MSERWIAALTDRGARFADGRVTDFGDAAGELSAAAEGTIICDLSHDGMIQVGGADAAAYLQAQFCNDVAALGEQAAQWNGWCSPKGRLLSTFLVWRNADGYLLQLPRALQTAIQKRMQMFVLRAKVTLTDAAAQWIRFGVAGDYRQTLDRFGKALQQQRAEGHNDHGADWSAGQTVGIGRDLPHAP